MRQDGHKEFPKVDLVQFNRVKAGPDAAPLLNVPAGARLYSVVNKLSLSGEPAVIDEILLPESLFPKLTEKRLKDRPGTLYQFYQDEFGVTVIRTVERLRAVKADALKSRLLGMKVGDPLLMIIRAALSFRDNPVELRHSDVDTRRYEYYSELMGG